MTEKLKLLDNRISDCIKKGLSLKTKTFFILLSIKIKL